MCEIAFSKFEEYSSNLNVTIPRGLHEVACSPEGTVKYKAEYKTVRAIIVPLNGEIRIPFVKRDEPGEFKEFMDKLVERLETNKVRFTNLSPEGMMTKIDELAGKDSTRELRDAVHGFEEITEDWEGQEAVCLVGEWEPKE